MPRLLKFLIVSAFFATLFSCNDGKSIAQDEQISVTEQPVISAEDTVKANIINGNLSLNQIPTAPNRVVLTGMAQHRLVTVYTLMPPQESRGGFKTSYYYEDYDRSEYVEHFMPGFDIIYGYNLLNVGHHDMTTQKTNMLFQKPVLVKTVYYPSFVQDSLNKKPINRNYYFISVYDQDTNGDTLISRHDLRRFYYFNAGTEEKIQLLPPNYSGVRSQYDSMNDVMYLFARLDENNDGFIERKEPLHIFWIALKDPTRAVRMY